ncbi:MAG: C-GCAxxG-C-C family (seleno)protein [Ignavibacteriaceae bacterium]
MKNNITRKDFLVNSSKAAVGLTAVGALSSLITTATAKGGTNDTAWPWPYVTLDPDEARIKAHYLYYNGKACCAGVFGGILELLKAKVGDPYNSLPMEIMLFGGGGGAGWGSLCGTLNGGAALISLVTDAKSYGELVKELWGWYSTELLPSNTANNFAAQNKYLAHKYDGSLPQNIAGSVLCHVSVTDWCVVADKTVGSTERKERCARIAGDVAAKTVEILNAKFAGTFTPTYSRDLEIVGCLICHSTAQKYAVMTEMKCTPCHSSPHSATGTANEISKVPQQYNIMQNYPNPFNPSTTIKFSLPNQDKVQVAIYDIQGTLVKNLINHEEYGAGTYSIKWNGKNEFGNQVASGIYIARILTNRFSKAIKMNLLK